MINFENIECDGFIFNFTGAINAFKFDEGKDKSKPNYHGLTHAMKGVDLIVEFPGSYLFLEVKDFHNPDLYKQDVFCNNCSFCEDCKKKIKKPFNHLRDELKTKFRDTFIYRWAEEKLDKPIYYICLLTLENALITKMNKEILLQLPVKGLKSSRWTKNMVAGSQVVNIESWNKSDRLNKWPVTKIVSPTTSGATTP